MVARFSLNLTACYFSHYNHPLFFGKGSLPRGLNNVIYEDLAVEFHLFEAWQHNTATWRWCRLQPLRPLCPSREATFSQRGWSWTRDVDPCREAGEALVWERPADFLHRSGHCRCQIVQYHRTRYGGVWKEGLSTVAHHLPHGKLGSPLNSSVVPSIGVCGMFLTTGWFCRLEN